MYGLEAEKVFEGLWDRDRRVRGTVTFKDGSFYTGTFGPGEGYFLSRDGTQYHVTPLLPPCFCPAHSSQGEWADDCRHGQGVELCPDGR